MKYKEITLKQLLQSLKDGSTQLAEVPIPRIDHGQLLIRTHTSLVSAGTERMLVKFGKSGLVSKARQQPDKVKMVLNKAKTDGVSATFDAVTSKLDQPLALGYSNVGYIAELGHKVQGFKLGDRVVSNGKHAEYVAVPKNLCAKIPDNVSFEAASFTVQGAVALQGIRLAKPTLGEFVVVIGLGLIGLMAVQMLKAQGCHVLGVDYDETRLALARSFGAKTANPNAENVISVAQTFSRGQGVDAVIITASTDSSDPVHQAAEMCRKRGRIILVGVVGLNLSRAYFYEKELIFQVSCSYGPGRYDPVYEEGGQDYPIGFVRWTEQRNFEAVLDLMSSGALDLEPLITHRFKISQADEAMNLLISNKSSLGLLLEYDAPADIEAVQCKHVIRLSSVTSKQGKGVLGFLGAGNYAGRVLIPAFKNAGGNLHTLISNGGISAVHFGKKFGFVDAGTDPSIVLQNDNIDTVIIATQHNLHCQQVLAALKAGKHVFCEKPLCLTMTELSEIENEVSARPDQHLMVGFNRRFAPHIVKMKSLLDLVSEPKHCVMTVNAGAIPADHWIQDPSIGGGRIIGEACHFIDLLRHLIGHDVISMDAVSLGSTNSISFMDDISSITLRFDDGSVGVIHYLANGHRAIPKERLEIFTAGRVLQLDNFRTLRGVGWPNFKKLSLWRQDKGQKHCASAFLNAVKTNSTQAISKEELFQSSRLAIQASQMIRGQYAN